MHGRRDRFRPGETVEVKRPAEILETLDADGAVDALPFMPEMLGYCGRRFKVSARVLQTCFSGSTSGILGFPSGDVVLLDGIRCAGDAHGDCEKACAIFWREAWLRRVDDADGEIRRSAPDPRDLSSGSLERLRSRLKTRRDSGRYFCQASELLKAGRPLARSKRLWICFEEVRAGNRGALDMARGIVTWFVSKVRRRFLGEYARGTAARTPSESVGLQPGDAVEVRSLDGIKRTLDRRGRNRGLYFFPDMHRQCGRRFRVRNRLERIIVDGTGEMRPMRDTVYLEDSMCNCPYLALGGCQRGEFAYWREAWLRRTAE